MKKNALFLNGGGLKGLCYIGVLAQIYEKNLIFSEYHGISIGSIFCLLCILRIPLKDIYNKISHIKNIQISLDNLLNGKSLIRENPITDIIRDFLPENTTFMELHDKYRVLFSVYTTQLPEKTCKIFNYKTTPNVKIIDAILASSCLIGIFPIVKIHGIEYIDGIFTKVIYPDNCLTIAFNDKSEKFKNDLIHLILKITKLCIPIKIYPKDTIFINVDCHSLDFEILQNPDKISQLICTGFNDVNFYTHS